MKLIPLACHGITDNTIYAPLKREVLVCEIEILRTLNGQHFCMALKSVYETARAIFVVTEYCAGGEMMEYVSKQEEDLRTDDVSRVAFQMFDAVNYCAQNNIIHRDIKPEVRQFSLMTCQFLAAKHHISLINLEHYVCYPSTRSRLAID